MAIKKRVILAAGHGGGDPGAAAQGSTEYVENIQITDKTAYYLRAAGFEVHVVPHTLGLVDSINWVNGRFKNLLDGIAIEIHKNAGGGHGVEVWTPSNPDTTSRNYCRVIVDKMAAATGLPNRGVKFAQNSRFGRLGWCDDTKTYACLIEAGFIDGDPIDDSMDSKMARGISNGILFFFGEHDKAPKPSPAPKKPARKTNEQIADEVIAGKWGNGNDRVAKLKHAGYDPYAIQTIVNKKMGFGSSPAPKPAATLKVGDNVQVTKNVDYNGTLLAVNGTYKVMEVRGDRIVIGRGGVVTAAIHKNNLRRV